ncbi:MAG: hypothetical protein L0H70_04050, partial [Xanthomonadales bacterium]|nr:hypothetical protein [Xanthomonadales bacterium]
QQVRRAIQVAVSQSERWIPASAGMTPLGFLSPSLMSPVLLSLAYLASFADTCFSFHGVLGGQSFSQMTTQG